MVYNYSTVYSYYYEVTGAKLDNFSQINLFFLKASGEIWILSDTGDVQSMSNYWEDYSHSICYIRLILSKNLFDMRSSYMLTGKIVFCHHHNPLQP